MSSFDKMITAYKEKVNSRQEYNQKILQLISDYLERYPDLRFGQCLSNLRVYLNDTSDIFYEEPVDTYNRIMKFFPKEQTNDREN